MTIYEKIKQMSVEELTEYLSYLCVASSFCLFVPDEILTKDFIKSLESYEYFCERIKIKLMECVEENE